MDSEICVRPCAAAGGSSRSCSRRCRRCGPASGGWVTRRSIVCRCVCSAGSAAYTRCRSGLIGETVAPGYGDGPAAGDRERHWPGSSPSMSCVAAGRGLVLDHTLTTRPRSAPRREVRLKTAAEKVLRALGPARGGAPHDARAAAGHTGWDPERAERRPAGCPRRAGVRGGAEPGGRVRPVACRRCRHPVGLPGRPDPSSLGTRLLPSAGGRPGPPAVGRRHRPGPRL